ncbi:MAG: DUF6118 family protein [Roseiarcus sp.]|jgi:hypothetical protein
MVDENHEDDGGAAQAFAALHAEVIVMRRAMESLPAIIKRMETPDYAPSFGAVIKSLTATEARLAAIEGHPALKLTPDQHASALKRAGADIMGDAARALRNEAEEVARERRNLADIVGEALAQEAQKRALLWTLGLGVVAGLVLFPLLGAFAPGGSYLATLATGNADRWQAGVDLMQRGDPAGAATLATASRLMNANADALQACSEAAKKAGKEQKCTINVAAPGQ